MSFGVRFVDVAGAVDVFLNQPIRVEFNAPVAVASASASNVQIVRDDPKNPAPAFLSFRGDPASPNVLLIDPLVTNDLANPSLGTLLPDNPYRLLLRGADNTASPLLSAAGDALPAGFEVTFRTRPGPDLFLDGSPGPPRIVSIEATFRPCTSPAGSPCPAGSVATAVPPGPIEPNEFGNPVTIAVHFDQGLLPDPAALSGAISLFRLGSGSPSPCAVPTTPDLSSTVPIATRVALTSNANTEAILDLTPEGILPLDDVVYVRVLPSLLRDLGGQPFDASSSYPADPTQAFCVSSSPCCSSTIQPVCGSPSFQYAFVEDFQTRAFRETTVLDLDGDGSIRPAEEHQVASDWAINHLSHPDVLRAANGFPGTGALGPVVFLASPSPHVLDTDQQNWTNPVTLESFTITDGVFDFASIWVQTGARVVGRGTHPLVLSATDWIRIDGDPLVSEPAAANPGSILVAGMQGGTVINYNSGCLAAGFGGAGGTAGARGGRTSPVDNAASAHGETGFGAAVGIVDIPGMGGGGGESSGYSSSGPGAGGGGSFSRRGKKGMDGSSFTCPSGFGHWLPPLSPDQDCQLGLLDTPEGGCPGPLAFGNGDLLDNYFGPGGEYPVPFGGEGGGGGGDKLDGSNCTNFPGACGNDDPGGGGGGGGGAVVLRTLGSIRVQGRIVADGGPSGNGTANLGAGQSTAGASGGGGSGGVILLQALEFLDVSSPTRGKICPPCNAPGGGAHPCNSQGGSLVNGDLLGGIRAVGGLGWATVAGLGFSCGNGRKGGDGGAGFIQLQVQDADRSRLLLPEDVQPGLLPGDFRYPIQPCDTDFVDTDGPGGTADEAFPNLRLDLPTPFGPVSYAQSRWILFGTPTKPGFPRYCFDATDPSTGLLRLAPTGTGGSNPGSGVDLTVLPPPPGPAAGLVRVAQNPPVTDLRVLTFLGAPDDSSSPTAPDAIPRGSSILVRFQGALETLPGSGVVDPTTITPWVTDIALLEGMPLVRWRVALRLPTHPSGRLDPRAPQPAIDRLRVRFEIQ